MANLHKAFGKIYDQYVDKIYRFVYLKVNSREIAQDLTSEVFVRGWHKFQEGKDDIKNMQAFLYQIARNLTVDHYRNKAQAQMVSTDNVVLADNTGRTIEEKAFLDSEFEQVKASLAKINDDYRDMIIWYYLEELSVPEICQITGKSQEAVRVQIHRSLKALRKEIEGV